ncbi:c-type cytochrome [Candidatus Rariloculus sp.]|uniref:c-type cytochrome n=1 Tax=Candidatus Rariloculus sp. TaxID=3101265 RepID=UPI003D11FEE9
MRSAKMALLATGLLAAPAMAQHATAFDIEDGGRAFANSCANCHGPDGDLIAGIDLGRGLFRRELSDAQIADIIVNGIPDTPMPPTPRMSEQQALHIVAYLRSTTASQHVVAANGDPGRGRAIFEGKGTCTDCHRINGLGSRLGPDLSSIGLLRRAAELEQSLLDPAAEVQPANRFYSVTTANNETITGRLLNHDTFTVQLFDTDERLRSFLKADLLDHGFAESTMPSFGDELGTQEIADVVSYLVSLRGISIQDRTTP